MTQVYSFSFIKNNYRKIMKLPSVLVLSLFLGITTFGHAGEFTDKLDGDLIKFNGKRAANVPKGSLSGKTVIALYFSAHWCPPCREFTPTLAATYTELSAKYPQFELVFVSWDKSEKDMEDYMESGKMNYPAINFKDLDKYKIIKQLNVKSIPHMVVVDVDGNVLSNNGEPLRDHAVTLVSKLDSFLAQPAPTPTPTTSTTP
jgi:thiol-disulfide isomerase/thioredoxin